MGGLTISVAGLHRRDRINVQSPGIGVHKEPPELDCPAKTLLCRCKSHHRQDPSHPIHHVEYTGDGPSADCATCPRSIEPTTAFCAVGAPMRADPLVGTLTGGLVRLPDQLAYRQTTTRKGYRQQQFGFPGVAYADIGVLPVGLLSVEYGFLQVSSQK